MYDGQMPAAPAIEICDLTKQFRGSLYPAVDKVSFSCGAGEILGIIGENGAGKTTILRLLATMLTPDSGSGTVCGYKLLSNPLQVRHSIGILFGGTDGLYERLSAAENILYFARLNGLNLKEANRRLTQISDLLDLNDFLDRRAGTFSTGMRQRTLIARALVHDPQLMLLDEPVTGLDPAAARNIYQFIESCRQSGRTLIFSTHDLTAAERLCDRVMILHKGRIAALDTPQHLAGSKCLEERLFEIIRGGADL